MHRSLATLSRIAGKLRGRSIAEFRERAAQSHAAWRERTGRAAPELSVDAAALAGRLGPGVPESGAALLAEFRVRRTSFFGAFDDPQATVATLSAHVPTDRARVLARAERIVAGHFDLLGYEGLDYGDPVDWQRDPVAARRPRDGMHWSRVPYLDAAVVGDHKVTWEINRQQYLVPLGQAYWYTGDQRYARAFADHVTAWMDANPPKQGINWASSLEVAFRAMSWIWALHFFRDAPALTPALYARMLAFLHVHAQHLERYLSTYFSPNTHLTGEALGLVFIGALVPELAGAERWRRTGLDVLRTWLPRQIRADGGYFEQATQYHRYTTEFTLQLLLLDERHDWGLEPTLRPLLAGLLDYLQAVTRPDGTIPLIGDDDGGKLVDLDGRPPDDVRGVFAQAAVCFGSDSYARTAGDEPAAKAAAIWLFGAEAATARFRVDRDPGAERVSARSSAFRDTGMFVLRDDRGARAAHACFDCGPHGAMNAGHAHADVLALIASAGDRPLLVDSGTFSYPGPERNAFRGAGAHNTLLVDGEGSSIPARGAFQWEHVAKARLLAWEESARFAFVEGTHDGFARLPDPVEHRRAVLFLPSVGWVVRDQVRATAEHGVRTHWHLAPDLVAEIGGDGASASAVACAHDATTGALRPALRVGVFGTPGAGGTLAAEPAWISPRYGARDPGTRLVYEQRTAGTQEIITFLLPGMARARIFDVRELVCTGGARAFLLDAASPEDGAAVAARPSTPEGRRRYVLVLGGGGRWSVADPDTTTTDADSSASGPWLEGDMRWAWLVLATDASKDGVDASARGRRDGACEAGAGYGSYLRHQGRAILGLDDGPLARAWATSVRRGTEWLDDDPPRHAAAG